MNLFSTQHPATVEMQGEVLYSAILWGLRPFDELDDYPLKPDIQLRLVIRGYYNEN
jgi:hypothetical protein